MKKVEVFFDYSCPFCYLGLSYLDKMIGDYPDVEIVWRGCEVHPTSEERSDLSDEDIFWDRKMIPRAEKLGLKMVRPQGPTPYSDVAFRGMLYLEDNGIDVAQYNRNVFIALFAEGKNIEDKNVLLDCMSYSGIDKDKFLAALDEKEYIDRQNKADDYTYVENKVEVVPSFICGDKRYDGEIGLGITDRKLKKFLDSL